MTRRTPQPNDRTNDQMLTQAKTDARQQQSQKKESHPTAQDLNQVELDTIEDEVGLEEVDVDSEDLNLIAEDDDSEEEFDEDASDIDDEEIDSDLPQEMTQSYGTGLQGQPVDRRGKRLHLDQNRDLNQADAVLTGGDVDADYEQANAVGDEAVGGTVATPDQDIVDDLGAAVGLEMDDRSFLRTNDILEERDDRRWELDPKSSTDYQERQD